MPDFVLLFITIVLKQQWNEKANYFKSFLKNYFNQAILW